MIAKDMRLDVDKIQKEYERDLLTQGLEDAKGLSKPLEHPVIVSYIKGKDGLPLTSLKTLVSSDKINSKDSYRVRFSASSILPDLLDSSSVLSFLQFCNKKTGLVRPVSNKNDKAKHNEKLCICLQFLGQDSSLMVAGDQVRVNLIQENSNGFFKGIDPADLLGSNKKATDAQLQFKFILRTLLRFNVHIEGEVKVQGKRVLELSPAT